MIIKRADILAPVNLHYYDIICFTSNAVIKKNGALVMGAGVAKAFRDTFKGIDLDAGDKVGYAGNKCQFIGWTDDYGYKTNTAIVAFPTKSHWRDPSDIALIEKSARELIEIIDGNGMKRVALPKPGCRNGGLDWIYVKSVIEPIFDDRITIVYL